MFAPETHQVFWQVVRFNAGWGATWCLRALQVRIEHQRSLEPELKSTCKTAPQAADPPEHQARLPSQTDDPTGPGGPAWFRRGARIALGVAQMVVVALQGWQALCLGLTSSETVSVTLRQDAQAHAIISVGPQLSEKLMVPRLLPYRHIDGLDGRELHRTVRHMHLEGVDANRFVFFADDEQASALLLILEGLSCKPAERVVGSTALKFLVAAGIDHDKDHATLLIYRCSATDLTYNAGPSRLRTGAADRTQVALNDNCQTSTPRQSPRAAAAASSAGGRREKGR